MMKKVGLIKKLYKQALNQSIEKFENEMLQKRNKVK